MLAAQATNFGQKLDEKTWQRIVKGLLDGALALKSPMLGTTNCLG